MKTNVKLFHASAWGRIFAIILFLTSFNGLAFGSESDLNAKEARRDLQIEYADAVAKKIISYLEAYKDLYGGASAPEEQFELFVSTLLENGEDPLIQFVSYVPEGEFVIIMHETSLVEQELRGKEFARSYTDGTWNDSAGDPKPSEPIRSMREITDYCNNPLGHRMADWGYKAPLEEIPDTGWCGAWHHHIMPSDYYISSQ